MGPHESISSLVPLMVAGVVLIYIYVMPPVIVFIIVLLLANIVLFLYRGGSVLQKINEHIIKSNEERKDLGISLTQAFAVWIASLVLVGAFISPALSLFAWSFYMFFRDIFGWEVEWLRHVPNALDLIR